MELVQNLKAKVKPLGKKIVLPEYKDERVLEATSLILKEGFAIPVLVGKVEEVKAAAQKAGFNIDGAEIIDPETYAQLDKMVEIFTEKRAKKGMTPEK
ncbi:MAG: phosphate acyltransferase, partial [Veillonella caviae]|nr:phosphate acyltransferase [Veillonella caviae]